MCLILVAWRAQGEFPLVVAANRDELHARPTETARWWLDRPELLGGRDLEAGGTWLAVTRDGRFAALTNYRDPSLQRADRPSRGELVPWALGSSRSVRDQLRELQQIGGRYNGFNLMFSDGRDLAVYESIGARGRVLAPGIYGLSNHLLDTPWPKVNAAKSALGEALEWLPDEQRLLELLRDQRQADDALLPRTGVKLEWERLLSSAFIRSATYGTRSSTVLLMNAGGRMQFKEWQWTAEATLAAQVQFDFDTRVPSPAHPGPESDSQQHR